MSVIRIPTTELYAPFLARVLLLLSNLDAQKQEFFVTSGFRSFAEQEVLYQQGRTTKGSIVTNAKPGQSNHNYGIAVDLTYDANQAQAGLQPTWERERYKVLAVEAPKVGLESGYGWKFADAPHIEMPLAKHGITLAMLKAKHDQGGIAAVWKYLDGFAW